MSERAARILWAVVSVMLTVNIVTLAQRPTDAPSIGTLARLSSHGTCVGIIAEGNVVFRALADGAVEAYRVGSGQAGWKPIAAITASPQRG